MKLFEQRGLEFEKELLEMIVDVCKISDPLPDDLSPDDPLIGPDSPLGLDSLDAVEIVVSACALDAAEAGAAVAPAREGWTALEPVFLRGRSQPVAVLGRREATRPEG